MVRDAARRSWGRLRGKRRRHGRTRAWRPSCLPKHPADVRVRRAVVARFPYAVVFVLLGDTVYVVAFAHGRRRYGYWKTRVQRRR